jgi:hypothetical protein
LVQADPVLTSATTHGLARPTTHPETTAKKTTTTVATTTVAATAVAMTAMAMTAVTVAMEARAVVSS